MVQFQTLNLNHSFLNIGLDLDNIAVRLQEEIEKQIEIIT